MKITITDSSVLPKSITVQESGDVVTVNSVTQPVTVTTDQLTTKIEGAIGDLTDVNITGVTDNQILAYDSATSKWVNENNSGGAATVDSVNGLTGVVVLDTDDIAEDGAPTNKYFTDARAQTVIDSNSAGFITADSTSTLTNKSGAVSQFTNDAGYLTSETDSQTLSLSTPNLSISGGNSVDLTPLTSGFITAGSTDTLTNKSGNISMFTNDSGYTTNTGTVTPTSTDTFTNKSGAISQWTNDSGYLTSETDSQTLSFADPILTISGSLSTVDLSALTPTSLPFSSITSTPTTLAGYGITDSVTGASTTTFTNKSGDISQWTNDSGYSTTTGTVTPSSTDTFTNKSGAISQWTNDSGYLNNSSTANSLADINYSTAPVNNNTLVWDGVNNYWEPGTVSGSGIAAVVDDTSPQLGGGLDVLSQTISSSNNIVRINDPLQIMAGNSLRFQNSAQTQQVTLGAAASMGTGYDLDWPLAAPVNNQYITVDVTGQLTFTTIPTEITNNNQLTNGAGYITSAGAGIAAVVDDTTPQLGGPLDANGSNITDDSRNYIIIGNNNAPSSADYDSFSSSGSRVFGVVQVEEVANPAVNQRVHSNPKLTKISLDADRNDNNARFRCNYQESVLQLNAFDVDPSVGFGRGFVGNFISAKASNAGGSASTIGQHSAMIVSPQLDGLTSNITVEDMRAVEVQPFIASGGTVDNMYGFHYSTNNSGTITNEYSLYSNEANAKLFNAGSIETDSSVTLAGDLIGDSGDLNITNSVDGSPIVLKVDDTASATHTSLKVEQYTTIRPDDSVAYDSTVTMPERGYRNGTLEFSTTGDQPDNAAGDYELNGFLATSTGKSWTGINLVSTGQAASANPLYDRGIGSLQEFPQNVLFLSSANGLVDNPQPLGNGKRVFQLGAFVYDGAKYGGANSIPSFAITCTAAETAATTNARGVKTTFEFLKIGGSGSDGDSSNDRNSTLTLDYDGADIAGDLVVTGDQIDFTGLPTSDPTVAGRLWNDSGTVKISAG